MMPSNNTESRCFRVGLTQWHAGRDLEMNVKRALQAIRECAEQGANLISLPENSLFLGTNAEMREAALSLTSEPIQTLCQAAKEHQVPVSLGGFKHRLPDGRIYNTAIVIDKQGNIAGQYNKVHLFDATIAGQSFEASTVELRGQEPVILEIEGVKIGMSICYDVRFPELYRTMALNGAEIFLVPSAFTYTTGSAHWEVLLRARAIENSAFLIASATVRSENFSQDAFQTWGHALAVSPWGEVLADLGDSQAKTQVVELDLSRVHEIRSKLPVLRGVQPQVYDLEPKVITLS